ncbi:hypothetical protein GCM10010211_45310 [Streptomyces albospinus]|uniref:Uncharacterized protein n=1 Tax=Streptomyces albospinus TaxID=285515 RepID=A0ABQ2V8J6_9ACTN|nr:hypothetical protein GCM10010211_45310 [Streptomyces albospinus]
MAEVDLNPVFAAADGVLAADVRILLSEGAPRRRRTAYACAFRTIAVNAPRTSAAEVRPARTPPAPVLCRMSGETIFSATGNPIRSASATASSAHSASPSAGVAMPYASAIRRPSGAVSAVRPSRAPANTSRTMPF